jgi:hypothetical protein
MKHDVHIFAVVRVKRAGVEAENHDDAVKKAMEKFHDLYELFDTRNIRKLPDGVIDVEFGEEFSHFLVDEEGDREFECSTWHEGKGVELPSKGKEESRSVVRLAGRLAAYVEGCDTATLADLGETVFGVADEDVCAVALEAARGKGGGR